MCEFCTQHGEGQKWYLTMRNYSRELLSQQGREEFIDDFLVRFEEDRATRIAKFDALRGHRIVYGFMRRMMTRRQKREHWGQVVPIEDAERIIDLQDSIVRMPCVCRSLSTGRKARYCFGIGAEPSSTFGKFPDYELDVLEKDEAKKLMRSFDHEGMVHSVWTFKTPYIGGLCNCDQDCLAYRIQVKNNAMQTMFRSEYVGMVDWDLCTGCKKCFLHCQFGAIRYSNTMQRATIEMTQCYGCGVCRSVCAHDAINLKPRGHFPGLPW